MKFLINRLNYPLLWNVLAQMFPTTRLARAELGSWQSLTSLRALRRRFSYYGKRSLPLLMAPSKYCCLAITPMRIITIPYKESCSYARGWCPIRRSLINQECISSIILALIFLLRTILRALRLDKRTMQNIYAPYSMITILNQYRH